MIKLNETPVRTSKNFNINNIKLENILLPEKITSFNNVTIKAKKSTTNIENEELIYGLGDVMTKQVQEKANQKIKLVMNKEEKEAEIIFKFDENNLNLIDNIQVISEENTTSTVTIKYNSPKALKCIHNGIINVLAKKNSKIHVIIVNFMNEVSNNFIAIQNTLEENSNIKYTIIDFGGKNSITNYYSNLKGDFAENTIDAIYLGKDEQLFDLNYIAELRGQKTNVNIEVEGALKDKAKKHFKGTIDFKKGAKKAKGNENETCMLLSDTAKSLALPMLLCSEEDVEGNHSCSSGKASEKELFYIMSRGFTLNEAIKLLVRAKFNKILENIENEELKEEILQEIDNRLE